MLHVVAAGAVLSASQAHPQTAGPKLEESDAQATALVYKADTTKVDARKYPNHAAAQSCANCQLFQGKAKDAAGGCPLFAAKAAAWCTTPATISTMTIVAVGSAYRVLLAERFLAANEHPTAR